MASFRFLALSGLIFLTLNSRAFGSAPIQCELGKLARNFRCTSNNQTFEGPVFFRENSTRIKKARFEAAVNNDRHMLDNSSSPSRIKLGIEVEFPNGPLLSQSELVSYGNHRVVTKEEAEKLAPTLAFPPVAEGGGKYRVPTPISEGTLASRYQKVGFSEADANALSKAALPKLMTLPEDSYARPGVVFGGQFLYLTAFETLEDQVLILGDKAGEPESYGHRIHVLGGEGVPGEKEIDVKSFAHPNGFFVTLARTSGNLDFLFLKFDDGKWFGVASGDIGRYQAQLKRTSDETGQALEPALSQPSERYRYYEGTTFPKGRRARATWFVLDTQTLKLISGQNTFEFGE